MSKSKRVRVGNAGGYWGDDLGALYRQLTQGPVDYLTQDFLAEITMSILRKQQARNPSLGYAVDFVDQVRECLPLLQSKGTILISNAGGMNPAGCAREVARMARQAGCKVEIGVVEGDDIMERLDDLIRRGIGLENMETGEPLASIRNRIESANAYLGVAPVVEALQQGAGIVVTGRVTDTGVAAAAPIHRFGWDLDDWDRLASAVVAGHILECGAQATGGNLSDWSEIPSFQNMGYPIAEFAEDGSFEVTKHEKSGGVVNRKSVTAQLVYEMGDPTRYITPDVIADFTTICLAQTGPERVAVSGVRGSPRPDQLKVSISYQDGYKAHGTLILSRPQAVDKCRRVADTFWKRLALDFEETSTELVGYNACHWHLAPGVDPPEILLRLGVRDPDAEKVQQFSKLFTSLILNTVSGIAIVGARPRLQSVVAYWPCLIPASEITPRVTLLGTGRTCHIPWQAPPSETAGRSPSRPSQPPPPSITAGATRTVQLKQICHARSGDKGDTCNIGVVARSLEIFAWLRQELTALKVKQYFGEMCRGEVERFEVPNLLALNFLLHRSLGGGGTVSLRIDPQGKTMAEALLMMETEVPEPLLKNCKAPILPSS